MRIPTHRDRRTSLDNDSMTPMIDVVFLLLVFFVCASVGQVPDSLLPAELSAGQTEAQVDLPQQEPEEWKSPEVRIYLDRDAQGQLLIQLNERPVSSAAELDSRLTRLAELDPASRIIIGFDDAVAFQHFIDTYDRCQALGFLSISLAVKAE
ncbi:MAG: biopolymer transporter ExbD [Fuerstiella sp.]|nr:biopolymer transporter ExbD [Fuerstiella sp.]